MNLLPTRISLVIPAHNEGTSIAGVVRAARAAVPGLGQMLVVDDGSSDDTAAQAEAAGAEVLRLRPNRGKGAALRAGIREARGEVLAFIDADGQDDPRELPALLAALRPDVAMVIGSRFRGTLHDGAITQLNHAGNHALTWLFNRLFGSDITDTQAGFRVVRRDALDPTRLRATRYEIETELTAHVLLRGGRVVEIPVSRTRRSGGQAGFEVVRDGLRILRQMIVDGVLSGRPPGPR